MKIKKENGITLVALVITIIILLLLAGIAIATLGGENGIFAKVKKAKKAQLESEMKEQLIMRLQELQVAKKGEATLDDVTQDWANKVISTEYNPKLKEDASYNGKLMVMNKDKTTGKFMIDQNLNITTVEYNTNSVEVEYTTVSRNDNKVKINIVVTDKLYGIKQIDYPEGDPLKVVEGKKEQISIDYEVELGKEYKFVITSGDGKKTDKVIKIDNYFYKVTKCFCNGVSIDNNVEKVSYNNPYIANINITEGYTIGILKVMMGNEIIIDETTVRNINIPQVTDDLKIIVILNPLINCDDAQSQKLEVEVKYPEIKYLNVRNEYSVNENDYMEYKDKVEIKDNCVFSARVVDLDSGEVLVSSKKEINNILYEWEVWNLDEYTGYTVNEENKYSSSLGGVQGYCIASSTSSTASSGKVFTVYDGYKVEDGKFVGTGNEYQYTPGQYNSCIGKYVINYKNECAKVDRVWLNGPYNGKYYYPYLMTDCLLTIKISTVSNKGTIKYENITSNVKDKYPVNGKLGNYWYVLIEK